MKTEKLTNFDKSKIKLELKQVLISFLAIGIVLALVTSAAIIFILKDENHIERKDEAVGVLLALVVCGFIITLYHSAKNCLHDLRSNAKKVYKAQVSAKTTTTNWGWHSNPAADANAQPKLIEYCLVLENQKVPVAEEIYNRVVEGEGVLLHYTTKSNTLLAITRV